MNINNQINDAAAKENDMSDRIRKLERILCFFASVIQCGEPWTDFCEKEFNEALQKGGDAQMRTDNDKTNPLTSPEIQSESKGDIDLKEVEKAIKKAENQMSDGVDWSDGTIVLHHSTVQYLKDAAQAYTKLLPVAEEMCVALNKCHRTFLTLEKLKGFSTDVPPNIVLQSVIQLSEALVNAHSIGLKGK